MATAAFAGFSESNDGTSPIQAPVQAPANAAIGLGAILGLALALRLGVVALFLSQHPPVWLYTRAPELASLADSLCHGRGLSSPFGGDTGPSAFLAPGYPAVVAAVFLLFGSRSAASAVAILILQTAFAVLGLWAMMRIARSLFGARVARIAGLMGALGLPLLWVPAIFWETSLSTLLLTVAFWQALECGRRAAAWRWAMLGTTSGIAVLVNPALSLALLAILGWTAYRRRGARRRLAALGLLAMLAVVAPWPARNAIALRHFIPLRSNFGFELWMGNRPGGDGDFDESLFPIENRREHAEYAAKGEVAYMAEKSALAEAEIHSHPIEFVETSLKRAAWFWLGAGGRPSAWLGEFHATLTSALGLLGLLLLARRRPSLAALFLLPLAIFPLPYYIAHADLRFRLVVDPLLIVLSAHALSRIGGMLDEAPKGAKGGGVFADKARGPVAADFSQTGATVRG